MTYQKPRIKLYVDWDNDGDFLDAHEDISARLWAWRCSRGRDYNSGIESLSSSGSLQAVIDNRSEDYSPANASSPIYGDVIPGRKVRLTVEPPLQNYGHYDGATSTVIIPDDSAIQNVFDGGGTVEALIRPLTDGESDSGVVVSKGDPLNGWQLFVSSQSDDHVKITFYQRFSSGFGIWSTPTAVVPRYRFSRISVTYDNGDTANDPVIYMDGAELTIEETSAPAGTRDTDVGEDLGIGCLALNDKSFDGDIDDVRLFDDIRTAQEIDDNKWVEIDPATAGLVGYWKFNESSGTDVADSHANANDGTAANLEFRSDHLWTGRLESIMPQPSMRQHKFANLSAEGILAHINGQNVKVDMQTDIATGDAFDAVLDETDVAADERQIDGGQSTMSRFFVDVVPALEALRIIERTEGGFLLEKANGDIAFEDRHHRLLGPHIVSQASYSDAVNAEFRYRDIAQRSPIEFVVNDAQLSIRRFSVGSLAVLWTLPETGADSPVISPGQSLTFVANFPNPASATDAIGVDAWTTPVATTDYTANSQSDGAGTDLTSDMGIAVTKKPNTMEIAITNNGSVAAYITLLQARGTPVAVADPVTIVSSDAASQADFGVRTVLLANNFIPNTIEGQDRADFAISVFKDPISVVDLTILGLSNASLFEIVDRDISDRVTLVADSQGPGLGIDEDCFVEHISLQMGGDHVLRARYALSPAAGYSNFWVLGTSELNSDTILTY